MRTIKFRIFDKGNLNLNYPDGYVLENTWFGVTTEHYLDESHVKDYPMKSNSYILMQFTGLKDKNGKEIYEGDIIRYDVIVGEVRYNSQFCRFEIIHKKPNKIIQSSFIEFDIYELEIIGNIHSNPELLK